MTSIAKLKDRARKHEQKEDWKAAIEAYQKVLEAELSEDELELELGLFNRIGDLYLRINQTDQAVSYYEQAADKYAEAGFFNNAIALCNKALRHRPGRAQIYLKLSRLCAEQGFVTDARRWILDYAEREVKAGRVDAALDGLRDFVETSADPDVREFLAEQLASHGREQEAAEHFARAYGERMSAGQTDAAERAARRARAIDPAMDLDAVDTGPSHGDSLPALAGDDEPEEPRGGGGVAGLETRREASSGIEVEVGALDGLETTGGAVEEPGEGAPAEEPERVEPERVEEPEPEEELAGLEVSPTAEETVVAPEEVDEEVDEAAALGGLETFGEVEIGQADEEAGVGPGAEEEGEPLPLMEEEAEPIAFLGTESVPELAEDDEEEGEPLPMIDIEAPDDDLADADEPAILDLDALGPDLGGLAGAEVAEPEEVELEEVEPEEVELEAIEPEEAPEPEDESRAVIDRARELASRGLVAEALRELGTLSLPAAGADVTGDALTVVNEVLRLEPGSVPALQRRVEYAAHLGDDDALAGAYLGLAGALREAGAEDRARAMYERVLELDPGNADAAAALAPAPVAEEDDDGRDLDALFMELEPEAPAVEGPVPDEGGDPAFVAMLSQFKARVTESSDVEDAGDHYDLGLAFKEMGLVDEAIAEFQTALSGGEERLKVYEELGQCFILKGEYTVALKIFDRAMQVPHDDPAELLGVYYHLGQCHEELGQREKARDAYARVLAIDPSFQDVPDRMARL